MTTMQHDRTDRPGTDPRTGPHTLGPDGGAGGAAAAERSVDVRQSLIDGMGGRWGMVYSALPVVGFATAVPFTPLAAAIGVALAAAVALGIFRMWRGEAFMAAMGGVFGVAAAGGVSAWTGSADDFFLIGIWASLVGAVVTLVSLVVRRPLTGVIWNALHGGANDWRGDAPSRFAHDVATFTVLAVFAGRFASGQWLYLAGSTTGLAIADTVTGFPLTALAALVVVWAFRRSTKRLTATAVDAA